MERLKFKSNDKFYWKEKEGYKPNTLRDFSEPGDERQEIIREWMRDDIYGEITITHAQIPEESFTRQVTDISVWNDHYIISWLHPGP